MHATKYMFSSGIAIIITSMSRFCNIYEYDVTRDVRTNLCNTTFFSTDPPKLFFFSTAQFYFKKLKCVFQ